MRSAPQTGRVLLLWDPSEKEYGQNAWTKICNCTIRAVKLICSFQGVGLVPALWSLVEITGGQSFFIFKKMCRFILIQRK